MPYLESAVRASLTDGRKAMKPGELNFLFSKECADYINRKGLSYTTVNELIGALECAKLELYRIVAASYEDQKSRDNGGVYR